MSNSDSTTITDSKNPIEIIHQLIELLNDKEKSVINRRFGTHSHQEETLAAIGEDFGVTRERIRQIQNYGLKKLERNVNRTNLSSLKNWALETLKQHGDIISEAKCESYLSQHFATKNNIAELKLGLILFTEIDYESNKINFRPHFRSNEVSISHINKICQIAHKLLKKDKKRLSSNKLVSQIQELLKKDNINCRKKLILSALKLDRRLTITPNGISMTAWRHVNPKTLYDKIKYILNKMERPLHFSEITNQIIEHNFDKKAVNQHAVHNELIKRADFVLIGRGKYALKKWGYTTGTVADVITKILKEEGEVKYQELIKKVLAERHVKPVTVQININSNDQFIRDKKNLVRLASAA